MQPTLTSKSPAKGSRIAECGKPRILYLITGADRGGAQVHLLELAAGMQGNFDVVVAAGEEGFLTEECRARQIAVHIVPSLRRSQNPLGDVRAFFEVCGLLRRVKPDLVHMHTFKAGLIGRVAGWIMGVPSIYTVHAWLWDTEVVSELTSKLGRTFEWIAGRFCRRIITVSEAGERLVNGLKIAPRVKAVTIHNGIPDCGDQATHGPKKSPVIIMVARFMPPKHHAALLRAFAGLRPGPRLRLIGDGATRPEVEKLARILGISDRVEFLGRRDDVPRLLAESDIFVLSSLMEMFPISILEAMRAGLPVVASNVGGVSEAVTHGNTGYLVARHSIVGLTRALELLVDDASLRARLGSAARQNYLNQFQFIPVAERTSQLYMDVLRECDSTNRAFRLASWGQTDAQRLADPARLNK